MQKSSLAIFHLFVDAKIENMKNETEKRLRVVINAPSKIIPEGQYAYNQLPVK